MKATTKKSDSSLSVIKQLNKKHKPFYEQNYGAAYLGDSLDLMKLLPDTSVRLIVTSPPFALTSKKEYGNKASEEYVDWFMGFAEEFKRVLTFDDSLVIDLGDAYLPGHPVRSLFAN